MTPGGGVRPFSVTVARLAPGARPLLRGEGLAWRALIWQAQIVIWARSAADVQDILTHQFGRPCEVLALVAGREKGGE